MRAAGSVLTVAGEPFELLQFHFHVPSEHAIAGSRAPMEAHFVHGKADGCLAVVGVMMQADRHNDPLASVFANMPDEAGPEVATADATIDASAILPSDLMSDPGPNDRKQQLAEVAIPFTCPGRKKRRWGCPA